MVPCGPAERVIRLLITAQVTQGESEIVVRFALARIGISCRQPSDGLTEMLLRLCKLTTPQVPEPHSIVAAIVPGVATQCLTPVGIRVAGRMSVLVEMQSRNIQLVVARDLIRQ